MSKSDKLFSVVGTARNPDGTVKVRFANDFVARVKILNKAGCTDIDLHNLPEPMTKLQAMQWLEKVSVADSEQSFALSNRLADHVKTAKRGEVLVRAQRSAQVSAESATTADAV